jgi:hypothetical protein
MDPLSPYPFLPHILDAIDYSRYSILSLVDSVAAYRRRPIILCPFDLPDPAHFGCWIASPSRDFIFFVWKTARVHQDHIICHELAHMLLGHTTLVVGDDLDVLHFREHGLARKASVLRRSPHERAAEQLALTIQQELIDRVGLEALTASTATAPLWAELATVWGIDR